MSQKAETVQWIDCQKSQPKVESEAGQSGEIYPFSSIGFLIWPAEEWREQGHKKDEAIQAENDN